MTAILDTKFLFALTDESDRNHERVLTVAQNVSEVLILPVAVLPEICYLLADLNGARSERVYIKNFIHAGNQCSGNIPVLPVCQGLYSWETGERSHRILRFFKRMVWGNRERQENRQNDQDWVWSNGSRWGARSAECCFAIALEFPRTIAIAFNLD